MVTHYAEAATYLRTAILLGLRKPEDAIAWADGVIRDDPTPPPAVLDLAITKPELSAVRDGLRTLALPTEPPRVVDSVLGLAARDLAHGRRCVDDTLQVLIQCRRFVSLEPQLADEIRRLEMRYMVAGSGSPRELGEIHSQVAALVRRFVEVPPLVNAGGQ